MVLMGHVSINGALLPRLITGYPGHQKPWWNVRSLYVEVPCFCFFFGGVVICRYARGPRSGINKYGVQIYGSLQVDLDRKSVV